MKVFPCGEFNLASTRPPYPKKYPEYFTYSGEKRCPKKGEWYLSGALGVAYLAPNELSMEFHIAAVIPNPPKEIIQDGFIYKLYKAV